MTFPKFFIVMIGLTFSLALSGCGAKPQPENKTQNQPESNATPVKKTISGVFTHIFYNNEKEYMTYDFRTDGTVVFEGQEYDAIIRGENPLFHEEVPGNDPAYDNDIKSVMLSGKGTYSIQDDKITSEIALNAQLVFDDNSTGIRELDSIDSFKIDGDDLIHLSIIIERPDGEKETNADNNEIRYMRK